MRNEGNVAVCAWFDRHVGLRETSIRIVITRAIYAPTSGNKLRHTRMQLPNHRFRSPQTSCTQGIIGPPCRPFGQQTGSFRSRKSDPSRKCRDGRSTCETASWMDLSAAKIPETRDQGDVVGRRTVGLDANGMLQGKGSRRFARHGSG
jgi:hypothetical protein